MTNKLMRTIGSGLLATTLTAYAGDYSTPVTLPSVETNSGDWCSSLQSVGKLYENKENPFIQEVKIFGRAHYQAAHVDGDVNGTDFHGNGGELRRLRFGTSIKFLNGFKASARANFSKGSFRDESIGYTDFDELNLSYKIGDVGALEGLTVGYGRYKFGFGGEEHSSSKRIKTLERSNLNNFYAGARATGARIEFEHSKIDYSLGIYSSREANGDSELFADWGAGVVYMLQAEFEGPGGDYLLQGVYSDSSSTEADDGFFNSKWALSATHQAKLGPINLFTNVTYGEDHNSDSTYGFVLMPSVFLIEDKLEAVLRYQFLKGNGTSPLRATRRYVQRVSANNGSGDANHTIYAGLNYFLCDHNLKLMAGVEYETLSGGTDDVDAVTVSGAVRFYF